MSINTGFPPVANKDSRVLILGSMPGQISLDKNQYYAHPRNAFWSILRKLLNADENLNYKKSKQLLIDNKIALWDVLKSCYRKGSLDSNIDHSSIEVNDFKSFFIKHPEIRHIYFNGAKAEQLFKKRVLNILGDHQNLGYHKLPSTSPAHAAMSFEQKLQKWKIIKEHI